MVDLTNSGQVAYGGGGGGYGGDTSQSIGKGGIAGGLTRVGGNGNGQNATSNSGSGGGGSSSSTTAGFGSAGVVILRQAPASYALCYIFHLK